MRIAGSWATTASDEGDTHVLPDRSPRHPACMRRLRGDPANVPKHDQITRNHLSLCEEELEALRRENDRLREENQHLTGASDGFGQLAERLNTALRAERRIEIVGRRRVVRSEGNGR